MKELLDDPQFYQNIYIVLMIVMLILVARSMYLKKQAEFKYFKDFDQLAKSTKQTEELNFIVHLGSDTILKEVVNILNVEGMPQFIYESLEDAEILEEDYHVSLGKDIVVFQNLGRDHNGLLWFCIPFKDSIAHLYTDGQMFNYLTPEEHEA